MAIIGVLAFQLGKLKKGNQLQSKNKGLQKDAGRPVKVFRSVKICRDADRAGLAHARADRSVHDPSKVSGLLSVPRNAYVLEADEDEGEGPWPSKLVKSAAAWRVEVNRLQVIALCSP
ncbi:hypothetical protein B0H14DRAFT_2609982 [Mycena olivaceomarginata]|nr:hypothetical protein B0H14DRAFT_2609982 [Mycena olivaceomarginata]